MGVKVKTSRSDDDDDDKQSVTAYNELNWLAVRILI
jgi:hypothetical protein